MAARSPAARAQQQPWHQRSCRARPDCEVVVYSTTSLDPRVGGDTTTAFKLHKVFLASGAAAGSAGSAHFRKVFKDGAVSGHLSPPMLSAYVHAYAHAKMLRRWLTFASSRPSRPTRCPPPRCGCRASAAVCASKLPSDISTTACSSQLRPSRCPLHPTAAACICASKFKVRALARCRCCGAPPRCRLTTCRQLWCVHSLAVFVHET